MVVPQRLALSGQDALQGSNRLQGLALLQSLLGFGLQGPPLLFQGIPLLGQPRHPATGRCDLRVILAISDAEILLGEIDDSPEPKLRQQIQRLVRVRTNRMDELLQSWKR